MIRSDTNPYDIDLPGIDAKDVEITFENGILNVEVQCKSEHSADQNRTRRVERSFGTFVRRFSLPDMVDADGIEARMNQGVLNLTIQKRS